MHFAIKKKNCCKTGNIQILGTKTDTKELM